MRFLLGSGNLIGDIGIGSWRLDYGAASAYHAIHSFVYETPGEVVFL